MGVTKIRVEGTQKDIREFLDYLKQDESLSHNFKLTEGVKYYRNEGSLILRKYATVEFDDSSISETIA